jgi:hypothetical protein
LPSAIPAIWALNWQLGEPLLGFKFGLEIFFEEGKLFKNTKFKIKFQFSF